MADFFEKYVQSLKSQFPIAGANIELRQHFDHLVSPIEISLPYTVYRRAEEAIRKIYEHAHSQSYILNLKNQVAAADRELLDSNVKNHAVLMAYDFHYDMPKDQLSLIEINTNASAFLMAHLLYKVFPIKQLPWGESSEKLKKSFAHELQLSGFKGVPRAAIIDENIPQQKMQIEFIMYSELFRSWGWSAEIFEQEQVPLNEVDFIYNRTTDFTFSGANFAHLRKAYLQGRPIFSPHPVEYLLLAAKERLIELAQSRISDVFIPTFELKNHPDLNELWASRKNLFFKPKRSYGAKGVYRGSSISRKKFDEIASADYLAQEFRPAGTFGEWKYDLRFYVYQDEIQLGIARIYQGQVTNFSVPGGGLARLTFV